MDTLTATGTSIYGGTVTTSVTTTCPGTTNVVAGDLNGDGIVDQADCLAEQPQNASALAKVAQGKTTAGFERTRLYYLQIYLININQK